MSWKNEVGEIKKRLRLIQQMGGKDKIKRQHDAGRTTVRERILSLLDKNSFKEIVSGPMTISSIGPIKNLEKLEQIQSRLN